MTSLSALPLRTRADVEKAAEALLRPLLPLFTERHAGIDVGDTGAMYPKPIQRMESFSRPLWAIVPMLMGHCQSAPALWAQWKLGLIAGTDPENPEYWGRISHRDQRMVEMAAIGMGMAFLPETFYGELTDQQQKNLYQWLNQINLFDMHLNNWTFFRVMVNLGFMACGLPVSKERMDADFALIENHYEGDGWYFDYVDQRDYYTFWGFHFYGLVYAKFRENCRDAHVKLYTQRAQQAAMDYICWFDSDGAAVPYGRSLTYRFAQSAFFSAMAFADAATQRLDYGMLKHLVLGNLRDWLAHAITDRDGVLTLGYHYPNVSMGEGYNAPGSPYWGMKVFLCLALPEEHPFWQAEEKPCGTPPRSLQPHARMLVIKGEEGRHVMAYTAGNHCQEQPHCEAKYEKFVYSSKFGFSVSKAANYLKAGAFDNVLAVSLDGLHYRPRYGCESYEMTEDAVFFVWKPFPEVRIQTAIRPVGSGHIRVHRIETEKTLYVADGGFAIDHQEGGSARIEETEGGATAFMNCGISGAYAVKGYAKAEALRAEPNTNLMFARTLIPTLSAKLSPGSHTLVSAFLATVNTKEAGYRKLLDEVLNDANLGE